MRPPASLLALAVAAGTLLAPGAGALAATPGGETPAAEEASAADGAALLVDVVPGSAGRVAAGADLTVSVRITNPTDAAIPGGVAALRLDPAPVSNRDALAQWLAPSRDDGDEGDQTAGDEDAATDDAITGQPAAEVVTPALAGGDSRTVTGLTVAAASLPFGAGSPLSVHRLSVTVDTGDSAVTGRSAVAVEPGTPVPATRLAIAMPLTLPVTDAGVIRPDDLETLTADGGALDLQLRQASVTSVAIGVDPRIIASINLLGDSAPESALAWLDRLRSVPNETFPLSYADTDIAATSQVTGTILGPAGFVVDSDLFPAEPDATADGTGAEPSSIPSPEPADPAVPTQEELLDWQYTTTDVAWPRDDSVVGADLDVFAASGLTTTILSSTNTADSAGASARSGERSVVRSDAPLSDQLRSAVAAPTPFGRDAAIAEMTATLAMITAEGGASPPVVLATLDRSAPADSFPLATTVSTVTAAPWAEATTLADARAQPAAPVSVVDRPVDPRRIAGIASMLEKEPVLGAFSSAVADPVRITGERRLSLLALCSQSWAEPGQDWDAAVGGYLARSDEILSSVAVGSRTLTQASDNGDLPIVVTNALDVPVTVQVNVQALRPIPILAIRDSSVEVTIPPNSQQRAPIPTESIANGEVSLSVTLMSATGVSIGQPGIVRVSVRAGWETAVTTVLAILVVAVFILGVIRTVRRRRRIARGELADDRDGDARDLHDGVPARTEAPRE